MIAELFVTFLCDFMRRRRRPVFLVVDCHPTHRAKIVSAYIQSLKGKLELHFLRGYAPDLNPDGEGSRDERGGAVCYSAGPDFVG
jgi:transposase